MTQRQTKRALTARLCCNQFWVVLSSFSFCIVSIQSGFAEGIDAGLTTSPSAEIAPNEIPIETMEPPPPSVPLAPEASIAPEATLAPEPAPETPAELAPQPQQQPTYSESNAPEPSDEYTNTEEEIMHSPTKSIESYEKLRQKHLLRQSETDWSFNITIAPKAFKASEFRQTQTGPILSGDRPFFVGVLFSTEYYFLKSAGFLSLGLEAGLYTAQPTNRFGTLLATFQSAGPYAQYQFRYFQGQWFVPTIRTEYEWVHYNYVFIDNHISDSRFITRVDLGGLIYLNVLAPGDGARLSQDFGFKKVFFGAYYSISQDRNTKDFDLTEKAFRGVLRFEF